MDRACDGDDTGQPQARGPANDRQLPPQQLTDRLLVQPAQCALRETERRLDGLVPADQFPRRLLIPVVEIFLRHTHINTVLLERLRLSTSRAVVPSMFAAPDAAA